MKEYIEREAAVTALAQYFGFTSVRASIAVEKVLATIPAADVVEVRHGRWTEYHAKCDGGYGQIYYQHTDCSCFLYESPYNYCPNCGAKMDGGVNDAAD